MSDARTAIGFDRLPWLADEPQPPAKGGLRGLIPWVVAAILLVAGASYWIGQQNAHEPVAQTPGSSVDDGHSARSQSAASARSHARARSGGRAGDRSDRAPGARARRCRCGVREARRAAKRAAVSPAPRKVEPPAEAVKAPAPAGGEHAASAEIMAVSPVGRSRRPADPGRRLREPSIRPSAAGGRWSAPIPRSSGADGRDRSRNSKGRHFYRLQIGTTSQAQSEVLCQRMEKIRYSCAVVGLPWKPKGVER